MNNPLLELPRYLAIYSSYLGPKMYLVFALTVIAGIFEGVGIMMLFPLLEALDNGNVTQANEPSPILIYFNKTLDAFGLQDSIKSALIFITAAFILKGLTTFLAMAYGQYLRGSLLGKLKTKLFDELIKVRYSYFSSKDTGYFVNIVNEQTTRAMNSFYFLCLFGSQFILAIVYIIFAIFVAWRFGVMSIAAGGLLFILFSTINFYVRKLSRGLASENGLLSNLLIQTLQAFKYLVATNQTSRLKVKVDSSIRRLVDLQISTGVANSFTNSLREPLAVVLIMVIMLYQITYLEQPLTPILVSVVLFYRALNALLNSQIQLQNMLGQVGSLEIVEQEFSLLSKNKQINGQTSIDSFSNKISFKEIDFSYSSETKTVFSNLNIEIPFLSSVAFVGESGAGKSTLADLTSLILEPSSGVLSIDDLPSNSLELNSWRRQIGYVAQDTVIFDDTIANNICLWADRAKNGGDISLEIKSAAKQANLDHFINTLPDGYETMVGDRGVRLSGGQKQRLFIARELFRHPNIMILDEATSALDSESEKAIQASIDDLKGKITLIIIAHRLSSIKNVDMIYVLDKGKIAESGSFNELYENNSSIFKRMVEMQKI
ncbi:ABC transporter ATP-binding protein/permease [Gammaproteobacteria bacterium]|nr:ABC transporter ATP-binding protein/permease [Gammaproteobacteria bacterium]